MSIKSVVLGLCVVFLGAWVPKKGMALPVASGKAFAVFVASYTAEGVAAVGGVAGTAFFVSPTKAITAYHVLQPKSFTPAPGFERVRVWLVHEGYPAIELRPEQISYKPNQDSTVIDLGGSDRVAASFIYGMDRITSLSSKVESEGFMANSTGPVLEKRGADMIIVAVPKLERLHLSGTILRHSEVNLRSSDLNLKSAPCMQLSYQPIRGFSGCSVVANGKVIGMNSFADPEGSSRTWALQVTSGLLN